MDDGSILSIIVLVILCAMSAYFSATETAFSSMSRTRLKSMADEKGKKALLALEIAESYDKLLSTILIGNNIVNITATSIATTLFMKHYGSMGPTISTVVMTVVILIFGEISPKSLAKEAPEQFAIVSAPILNVLMIVLSPLNFIFTLWKKLLSTVFKINNDRTVTEDELLTIVEEAHNGGGIDKDESELIQNAIEFNDRDVTAIITPRIDVAAVDKSFSVKEIDEVFTASGFTRLPVYEETIDNLIGFIHYKDFTKILKEHKNDISEIITPCVYVPEFTQLSALLKVFQKNKSHMAIVSDEYGGTLGIVTMEDILEELVGEIWDEHDEIIETINSVSDNTYIISGSTPLEDMSELLDYEFDTDSTTVGGWVLEQLGIIPEKGASFKFEHFDVTVTDADSKRVLEIKVVVNIVTETEE